MPLTKPCPGRLAVIPTAVVFDAGLCRTDLAVLCAIGAYADEGGRCSTAATILAERLRISTRQVRRCLRKLESRGYLETAHPPGQPSIFQVRLEPPDPGHDASRVEGQHPGLSGPAPLEDEIPPATPGDGTSDHEGPAPATASDKFEEFWLAYPRGPHSNPREQARAKFETAIARGILSVFIILGARNYAVHVEREGTDPEDVAPAHAWLEQAQWARHLVAPGGDGPDVGAPTDA